MKKVYVNISNNSFTAEYNKAVKELIYKLSDVTILEEKCLPGLKRYLIIECNEETANIFQQLLADNILFIERNQ